MPNELWNDTPKQAVRFVGEVLATFDISEHDWYKLAESMDLEVSVVKDLADRISDEWDKYKVDIPKVDSPENVRCAKVVDEDLVERVIECRAGCENSVPESRLFHEARWHFEHYNYNQDDETFRCAYCASQTDETFEYTDEFGNTDTVKPTWELTGRVDA